LRCEIATCRSKEVSSSEQSIAMSPEVMAATIAGLQA
jgi:hypothetical protein